MTTASASSPSIAGLLAPVVIVLLGWAAFAAFDGRDAPPRDTSRADAASIVETATVEAFTGPFVIEVDGEATPYRLVTLAAEVPGRIEMKSPLSQGGRFVPSGAALFEIDRTDFVLNLERLTAQVRQADEELATSDVDISNTQALADLARQEWEIEQRQLARVQDLAVRGAATERDLDAVRAAELAKKTALQTLENEILTLEQQKKQLQAARDLADAQRRQALVDLERADVIAPLDATVVETLVEQGDYVKVGDPLVRLSDSSRIEVKCSLQIDELIWILLQARISELSAGPERSRRELPPTPVEVHFAYQGHELIWDAMLSRYAGNGLDPATRLVDCRVTVDHPEQARLEAGDEESPPAEESVPAWMRLLTDEFVLVSGMYVSVHIPISLEERLLRVPAAAVRPGRDAEREVWVVEDGRLQLVAVEIAERIDDDFLVRSEGSDLEAGERVIVSPLPAVREGMLVEELDAP